MGKSKSKKRNRTKALYEAAAAAAAKRRILRAVEDDDADDGATIDTLLHAGKRSQSNQGTQVGSLAEENVGEMLEGCLDPSQPQPSSSQGEKPPTHTDIATTLRTIRHLAKFPDIFLHSKDYKELRGALHPLVTERLKSYDKGIDYRQKATAHLSHKRWSAALSSLTASKDFQQVPKQGTIQRWVRDVDLCEDGPVKIKLLTSILSFKANTNTNVSNNNNSNDNNSNSNGNGNGNPHKHNGDEGDENGETDTTDGVNKHDPARALIEAQESLNKMIKGSNGEDDDTNTNTKANAALKALEGWRMPSPASSPSSPNNKNDDGGDAEDPLQTLESRIVYKESASERTPPNRYDLLLHATEPFAVLPLHSKGNDMISQSQSHSQQEIVTTTKKHMIPFLNGAFCLESVFAHNECSRLIRAASILGYRPDHPSNLSSPTGIDSCEWLVDDSIHDLLYDRVREHLPLSMGETSSSSSSGSGSVKNGGNKKANNALCGINKRWRFFRYGKNCVYRPHIDGSWPAGSLSEDGKSYELDKSGSTRSYLTFLIYLNDDFEGGETKFYYPEEEGSKALVVRGIVPQMGSVLVFPQGNTASLLHEGSAVTKGTKYVIRTDVLYKH